MFTAPDTYQASYKSAPGYDWSSFGLWDAENKPRGAAISYYVAPVTKRDTSMKTTKADSVWVKIYNEKNENIRTLRWKADTGMNRHYWNMDEKGFRVPGSPRPRPGVSEPSGTQVLPGTYKVVINAGAMADSTLVIIKDDPRTGNRNEVKLAQRAMQTRLRRSTDKLVEGVDRLSDRGNTSKTESHLKGLEGKQVDSLKNSTKRMQAEIKSIREAIFGKPQTRQGYGSMPQITVINQWQQASSAITAKAVVPGKQEEMLVERAEGLINEAIQQINLFFDVKWKAYRKQVEETPVKMFKDYDPL